MADVACSTCGRMQPQADFPVARNTKTGHHPQFAQCKYAKYRTTYLSDPEKYRERARWAQVRSKYKLSKGEYTRKFEDQDGKCAICKKPQVGNYLSVDHDHACCPGSKACGKCNRALLCARCNGILGLSNDNPDLLRQAMVYLQEWSK